MPMSRSSSMPTRRARQAPPARLPRPGRRRCAETVAAQMRERDQRDSTRAEAPLTQAPDAVYIDSTGLTLEGVEEEILAWSRSRVTNGKDFS